MLRFDAPFDNRNNLDWHQDGQYWPIRPLATCTAWLALDDATPENGCLRVLPWSHLQSIEHQRVGDSIIRQAHLSS